MTSRVLIVGASHAGVQLAVSLREKGHRGPIALVGAEAHAPYHRPPLSKALLSGAISVPSTQLRSSAFFETKKIGLVLGEAIVEIDLESGTAHGRTGTVHHFDQLALATGARVRQLNIPGDAQSPLQYLRHLDDVASLSRRLATATRILTVGGGFIGLEAAATMRGMGREVTIVEAAGRLLARSVSPETAQNYLELHRAKGNDVRLGRTVVEMSRAPDGSTDAYLDDGSRVSADVVLVGVGVEARVELAEQLGLHVDSGVVVDGSMRTSDPRVVAVGDVTALTHTHHGELRPRLESVQNATDQATVAASTILGVDATYDTVPWVWSDQFETKLQIAGVASESDKVVMRGSVADDRFTVLRYRDDRMIAGECFNSGSDFVAIRRALTSGVSFSAREAADKTRALKALL